MLAAANITALDASARDKDGHTPNECFKKCRNAHCAVSRKSFDVERTSFTKLLSSVAGKVEIPIDMIDNDKAEVILLETVDEDFNESILVSEIDSDSASDKEYVDAADSL